MMVPLKCLKVHQKSVRFKIGLAHRLFYSKVASGFQIFYGSSFVNIFLPGIILRDKSSLKFLNNYA